MVIRPIIISFIVFMPILLFSREEASSANDKMALSGLTSNHNKVFGVNNLIRPKKDNPNILSVNIDPIEYQSWVQALNDLLKKASNDGNKRVAIGIQRANGQLKAYLDRLNGLDKTSAEASGKIKKALEAVTTTQKELESLPIDKQSLIYAAYETVSSTCEKIKKELSSLLDVLQGSQLIGYDADNVIKKTASDKSYEDRISEIKKLYDGISVVSKFQSSVVQMKETLIQQNKNLQAVVAQLKKAFLPWYSSTGLIQVGARSGQEKNVQEALLKGATDKVRQGRKVLDSIGETVEKYPKFQDIYDYLVSKFTILEQNIDQLKIAIATAR